MKNLLIGLGVVTGVCLLILIGFLAGSGWFGKRDTPQEVREFKEGSGPVSVASLPSPPPPVPPPPKDEVRIRETLEEGKTYEARSNFKMKMRTSHKDWGAGVVVNVHYEGFARIQRHIEKNDGRYIRELRTFSEVKTATLETALDDLQVDLGVAGDLALLTAAAFNPKVAMAGKIARNMVEGRNLAPVLSMLKLDKTLVDQCLKRDPRMRVMTQVEQLQGKQVRLTYDVKNPDFVTPEPVVGTFTEDELRFLGSSVLYADALLFPDLEIKKGERWSVNGMCFIGLLDPSMLIRPEGEIWLKRGLEDQLVAGKKERCVPILFDRGELTFKECDRKAEQSGTFRPETTSRMVYSPQDKVIIEAELKGKGRINIKSRDHLLFERVTDAVPDITIQYSCKKLN